MQRFYFFFITYFTTVLRRISSQLVDSSGFFIHLFSVLLHENVRQTTEIQPNAPAEGSNRWKCWFEKLTFAISRQRLTLAGQEMAALQEAERPFSVSEVLTDKLNISTLTSQDALLPAVLVKWRPFAKHFLFSDVKYWKTWEISMWFEVHFPECND